MVSFLYIWKFEIHSHETPENLVSVAIKSRNLTSPAMKNLETSDSLPGKIWISESVSMKSGNLRSISIGNWKLIANLEI